MDRRTFAEVCRVRSISWGTVIVEYMYPHTIRTLARAGFDWLWLDNEHAHHSYERIQEAIRTAEDVGVITVLRVTNTDYSLIARGLDLGADAIMVPRVETPEQVRRIISWARYPPIGSRGFGIRSSVYGVHPISMAERIQDQNNNRFLFIQIESQRGAENLELMLEAAEGQIDAAIFGPADFQMDIGKPDTPEAPELIEAACSVAEICEQFGIASGTLCEHPEDAQTWLDRGYNLIACGFDDTFLTNGAVAARNALRRFE